MVPSLVDVCRKADSCWEQSSCPPSPTPPPGLEELSPSCTRVEAMPLETTV